MVVYMLSLKQPVVRRDSQLMLYRSLECSGKESVEAASLSCIIHIQSWQMVWFFDFEIGEVYDKNTRTLTLNLTVNY
jgi:hypothetical protein